MKYIIILILLFLQFNSLLSQKVNVFSLNSNRVVYCDETNLMLIDGVSASDSIFVENGDIAFENGMLKWYNIDVCKGSIKMIVNSTLIIDFIASIKEIPKISFDNTSSCLDFALNRNISGLKVNENYQIFDFNILVNFGDSLNCFWHHNIGEKIDTAIFQFDKSKRNDKVSYKIYDIRIKNKISDEIFSIDDERTYYSDYYLRNIKRPIFLYHPYINKIENPIKHNLKNDTIMITEYDKIIAKYIVLNEEVIEYHHYDLSGNLLYIGFLKPVVDNGFSKKKYDFDSDTYKAIQSYSFRQIGEWKYFGINGEMNFILNYDEGKITKIENTVHNKN